ncbi:MAG: hypothetical protein HZA20_10460 [Nitrospirae bacterium]|nr:hypothetical protein [Nitrospirota bacterium]
MHLKGKKIACFVALPHHTRFLWPITGLAEKSGAKIVFFTTLADFPYEMDLIRRGKECRLLQSYATPETRRRIEEMNVAFFDKWVNRCFDWDGLRHWPFVMQSSLIPNGFEDYVLLEEFIAREKPDMFLALHERNRWGKIIGHLSARHGVPYVTLQEGDCYEDRLSFSAHTEYSTALLLWGNGTVNLLAKMKSAPEKFVLTGNTHLAEVKRSMRDPAIVAQIKKDLNIPKGKKVVLFLVGIQWGVIQALKFWEDLIRPLEAPDVVPVFKWHPKVSFQSYKEATEAMFLEHFPECRVTQTYDPYKLLQMADYCVTLGKTTLAVEALSFGKPLFSLPGTDGAPDHYYDQGIAQSVWPIGDWSALRKTIEHGVPEDHATHVREFTSDCFHRINDVAPERAVEVMKHIFSVRANDDAVAPVSNAEAVSGRTSFIVPSGDDVEALLATLTSLSENVKLPDWETVIVVNNPDILALMSGVTGDVRVVEAHERSLAALWRKGAGAALGDVFVFIRPGVLYYKDEGFIEAARTGVAGMPIKNPDMSPYAMGLTFDFNHVPRRITNAETPQEKRVAAGGGIVGVSRKIYEKSGGFDARIDDRMAEADLSLSAREAGFPALFAEKSLAFAFRETFAGTPAGSPPPEYEWKGRIAFFAKWTGKLPKDDDYVTFAGDLLKT